jgi:hypothetical protein
MYIIAIVAAIALSVQAIGQNLIINGSFEEPDITNGSWDVFTSVPGWTIDWTTTGDRGPELEVWDPPVVSGVEAYDGTQLVELDSYDPTKISQNVFTVVGGFYELSYAWRPRPDEDCEMEVYIDGAPIGPPHVGTTGNWTEEVWGFVAASSITNIAFAETGNDDQLGMLLDDVSLVRINQTPFALCQDVVTTVCDPDVSIDAGSYDPDPDDEVTVEISPEGPYPPGITEVTLIITDEYGLSDTCTATVTVEGDVAYTVVRD